MRARARGALRFAVRGIAVAVAVGMAGCAAGPKPWVIDPKKITRSVVDADYVGAFPWVQVDADGRVHVSYYVARYGEHWGALKYAHTARGAWTTAYVDISRAGDVGRNTSLQLDSAGKTHIAYWDNVNSALKYASDTAGAWRSEVVDTAGGQGRGAMLALDATDTAHLIYYAGGELRYATGRPGAWQRRSVAPVGDVRMYPAIALDAQSRVHLLFYDALRGMVRYAVARGNDWDFADVAELGRGAYPAPKLALDPSGGVHAIFYDGRDRSLKYAQAAAGGWHVSRVAAVGDTGFDPKLGREDSLGSTPAILVDADGVVHVSYYDGERADMRYAVLAGGTWRSALLDSEGDVGRYSSLTTAPDGAIHIVYRDSSRNSLKHIQLRR